MDEFMSRGDYCAVNCGEENREGYKTCVNCGMLNVPTADVRIVEHGKWEDCEIRGSLSQCCSVCGRDCGVLYSYRYCPNCGAEMDNGR